MMQSLPQPSFKAISYPTHVELRGHYHIDTPLQYRVQIYRDGGFLDTAFCQPSGDWHFFDGHPGEDSHDYTVRVENDAWEFSPLSKTVTVKKPKKSSLKHRFLYLVFGGHAA